LLLLQAFADFCLLQFSSFQRNFSANLTSQASSPPLQYFGTQLVRRSSSFPAKPLSLSLHTTYGKTHFSGHRFRPLSLRSTHPSLWTLLDLIWSMNMAENPWHKLPLNSPVSSLSLPSLSSLLSLSLSCVCEFSRISFFLPSRPF